MTAGTDQDEIFVADEKTLFLLGNGPSLKGVDLKRLSGRASLGMNAAYRYWREISWFPTYYACLDTVVGLSHKDAIAGMIADADAFGMKRFLLRENLIEALGDAAASELVVNFDALRLSEPSLRPNPVTTGSHAAVWAATIGFRKIVILGVDGKYVERVAGAEARDGIELEIVEETDNPNYFFSAYQQKGDRFNIPNPRPGLHVEAWRLAAVELRRRGVSAVNGNSDSAVRYFPFIEGRELVLTGAARTSRAGVEEPGGASGEGRTQPTQPARNGPGASFKDFLRRQRAPLAAGCAVFLAGALAVEAAGPANGRAAAFSVLAVSAFLLAALLFVRNAAMAHIARLDQRIAALEAALRDLARRR